MRILVLISLVLLGISMPTQANYPQWLQTLFDELGQETMSKPGHELTGDELFQIYHLTKDINGADDGVFPMIETYGEKVRPILVVKLKNTDTSSEERETATEIIEIFFREDSELLTLLEAI
ncbi:hypothetical protein FE810_02835 [Thalassotalea litorea]|uniref:Uncharacterized protein n=1 Tax=Thalassotalea litorea TaxID=2020715 RepID=A0A5R9INV2_9GAMM|nr:hypothetical protein [Thalassotalea litorea]TLU67235.1 hypothetical protein FE810_02835 [Thalassotalea litorea]